MIAAGRHLSGLALACCLLLVTPLAHGQTPAQPLPATASTAAGPSPEEARQSLAVLTDPEKREQLIRLLQVIAAERNPTTASGTPAPAPTPGATPGATATPAATATTRPGPPALGVQLLGLASHWADELSGELTATIQIFTDFPAIRRWVNFTLSSPPARAGMLRTIGILFAVLGGALLVEGASRWALRRPRALFEAHWPIHDEPATPPSGAGDSGYSNRSRRLLGLIPLALASTALALAPIAAFAVFGYVVPGLVLGASSALRLAVLAVVNAYVFYRAIAGVSAILFSPRNRRLRLFRLADNVGLFVQRWVGWLTALVIYGIAAADVASILGLPMGAHDALVKLVILLAYLLLIVVILQSRVRVALWLRAPKDFAGRLGPWRDRAADSWHLVAIFAVFALAVISVLDVKSGLRIILHYFLVTIAVVIVARVALIVTLGSLDRFVSAAAEQGGPGGPGGLRARAHHYYPLLRGTVSTLVIILSLVALFDLWGAGALVSFGAGSVGGRLLLALIDTGVTVVVGIMIWEAVNILLDRHMARLEHEGQTAGVLHIRTLRPILRSTLLVAISAVVGMMVLSQIGVNVGPLLAGAGILGVAVGFGSQKLVQDFITGIFLLLENALRVGDRVTVAGLTGTVEALSIRTIRLRSADDSVSIIPFSSVTTVTNLPPEPPPGSAAPVASDGDAID